MVACRNKGCLRSFSLWGHLERHLKYCAFNPPKENEEALAVVEEEEEEEEVHPPAAPDDDDEDDFQDAVEIPVGWTVVEETEEQKAERKFQQQQQQHREEVAQVQEHLSKQHQPLGPLWRCEGQRRLVEVCHLLSMSDSAVQTLLDVFFTYPNLQREVLEHDLRSVRKLRGPLSNGCLVRA